MPIQTPFFVGGYYRDRAQGYTVIAMDDKGMMVKYDDDKTDKLDLKRMQTKATIYNNIQSEYRRNHPATTNEYFESLGFLSMHGRFEAELPSKSVSNFLDHYRILTGHRASNTHTGISLLGDVDKWGPELRIYFPATRFTVDLGPGIDVRSGQTPNILRINNNSVWSKLVALGFRLGTNHDVTQIRASVPPEKLTQFDSGRSIRIK
jgi:hypothetical protein